MEESFPFTGEAASAIWHESPPLGGPDLVTQIGLGTATILALPSKGGRESGGRN